MQKYHHFWPRVNSLINNSVGKYVRFWFVIFHSMKKLAGPVEKKFYENKNKNKKYVNFVIQKYKN